MPPIELVCPFGQENKKVILSNAFGGAEGYQIYIDEHYQGNLVNYKGKWVGHLNRNSELTIDDIQILGEIVDRAQADQKD